MDTATAPTTPLHPAAFEDGLGKRYHRVATGGEPLEILQLRDEFSTDACEHALRERVAALAAFQKTCFAQVYAVQRTNQNPSTLFVVSDRVPGVRLSTVLAVARQELAPLALNPNLCLIRQLVTAIALLHEKLPGIAHGAIAAERVIITPKARLVVVDHMLGSVLAEARYSPERYWKELRVALPPGAQPAFDQRADVMQIGILALELILGRSIDREEYPADRLKDLTEQAWTGLNPPPAELRAWLLQMLQLDTKAAFTSAVDAWADLERVLGGSPDAASFDALEFFMAEYVRRTHDAVVTVPSMAVPPPIVAAPTAAPSPRPPSGARVAAAPSLPPPVAVAPSPPPAAPAPSLPPPAAVAPSLPPPVAAAPSPAAPPMMPVAPPEPPSRPVAPPVVFRFAEVAHGLAEPSVTTHADADANADANSTRPRRRRRWIAAAAVLFMLASGGALFGRRYLVPPAAAEAPGTLVVSTTPAGVPVIVDGQPRGVTPLTVELAAGPHELKLALAGEARIIPFILTAGSMVAQMIELPKAAPLTGQLMVRSEPPGARVTIDGTPSGTAPLTVEQLAPGTHSVTLQTDLSSVTQEVRIEPGATASLVVPMTTTQGVPVSGWISVEAPTEVQVYEDTRLLGTSQSERIMVLAGRHEFSLVNEALGYRATRSVTVSAGKVSAIRLDWPTGSMALNAQPWADVWVDGEKKGETPIGNITVPIGTHEVVFRHPELGERVVRATVTLTTPARVTVDMRKP